MKRIAKKDVEFVLKYLTDKAAESKIISEDLTLNTSDIYYGQFLAFNEAITFIKTIL